MVKKKKSKKTTKKHKGLTFGEDVDVDAIKKRKSAKGILNGMTNKETETATKVRITCMVDGDVLAELKKRAGKTGKYQTLLNQHLRESLKLDSPDIKQIQRNLEEMMAIVKKLNAKDKKPA